MRTKLKLVGIPTEDASQPQQFETCPGCGKRLPSASVCPIFFEETFVTKRCSDCIIAVINTYSRSFES